MTWVECAVVAGAAGLLYLLPKWGGTDIWAWQTPPFNARYVGAIYLGALVPLVILAVTARWSPGRVVLWMIFTFTASIMVVMLAYADRFEWTRLATWVFWALYLFLPVNSAVFLWRLRDLEPPGLVEQTPAARAGSRCSRSRSAATGSRCCSSPRTRPASGRGRSTPSTRASTPRPT